MSCDKSAEVFWNTSTLGSFSFCDDEEDEGTLPESDFSYPLLRESTMLSIESIISNKCLNLVLDENSCDVMPYIKRISPEDTVRCIFHGEHCLLDAQQTLEAKLQLLDAAIEICDGSIIVNVILFMRRTLKANIFLTQLLRRKVAVKHYVNYLFEINDVSLLTDMYMAGGNMFNMRDIYDLLIKNSSHPNVLLTKLIQFNSHHSLDLFTNEDKTDLQEHISLLEFVRKHKLSDSSSVVECLRNFCETEFKSGKSADEVSSVFKTHFTLCNFQFDWILMNVLCNLKMWDKLKNTFIKSGWVTKKHAIKSAVDSDIFLLGVGQYDPPREVLEIFLSCIGDVSKSLHVAEKLHMHFYVINYYVDQKDRMALLRYTERIESAFDAKILIESYLNNPDIKWKN